MAAPVRMMMLTQAAVIRAGFAEGDFLATLRFGRGRLILITLSPAFAVRDRRHCHRPSPSRRHVVERNAVHCATWRNGSKGRQEW